MGLLDRVGRDIGDVLWAFFLVGAVLLGAIIAGVNWLIRHTLVLALLVLIPLGCAPSTKSKPLQHLCNNCPGKGKCCDGSGPCPVNCPNCKDSCTQVPDVRKAIFPFPPDNRPVAPTFPPGIEIWGYGETKGLSITSGERQIKLHAHDQKGAYLVIYANKDGGGVPLGITHEGIQLPSAVNIYQAPYRFIDWDDLYNLVQAYKSNGLGQIPPNGLGATPPTGTKPPMRSKLPD